ncbi:hypothetical protein NIE88_08275 [Sporolactobacillus shoreicorticis]|uniref:Uncharacterized protein n=1 Tax=Sporolactobacillus shoreicorticis TaxID=1923877 RepID=A0ABW5S829_9BACL|nr:hypothetical protein [Sporolactobacillus shoreicorticis]MCO7125765.1 hypothetical protein [Sporolactobacillus shoreicorticis]
MDEQKGISIKKMDFTVDYLMMQLEQIENKIIRKNEAIIDGHLVFCREKLAKSEKKIHKIDHLLIKAARGTGIYYSHQLENILFETKKPAVNESIKPWTEQTTRLLG